MATDNLLKAVVDAIAESDNEIGGYLLTRLTEAHEYGRDNGIFDSGSPTRLTSPVDVFKSTDVGRMVDILELDTPNGNEGSYTIITYVDAKNVILEEMDGAIPSFATEPDVSWRYSSLRVETALEFTQRDERMSLWVEQEPERCPYGGVALTPGAQQFLGMGEHVGRNDGRIDVVAPQRLNAWAAGSFVAGDVGKSLWIMPAIGTPNGNDGVRVISSVPDGKTAIFTGPAFVADELNVMWRKKTYAGPGYLTALRRENSEVVDGSASFSSLDQLRRALLIAYAEGEELDRIGRRYGVARPRGLPDEFFRRVLMVLPYMAKTTVYSLEILLEALFPQGGSTVYEDLNNHPNEVFISVPLLDPTSDYEGKAYLNGSEDLTSNSTTQVTVTDDPITVISVKLAPFLQQLEFDSTLPSADSPAWTFVTQGDTEGATFSASSSKVLTMVLNGAANNVGGYYQLDRPNIDPEHWDVTVWIQRTLSTTIGGYPWKIVVDDGEREIGIMINDTQCALGQPVGEIVVVGLPSCGTTNAVQWYRFRLQRRGDTVRAYRDGVDVFGAVAASGFSASSSRRFQFGMWSNGQAQNNVSNWRFLLANTEPVRNYWNMRRDDGVLVNPATLNSASSLFLAGDTGKHVRTYSTSRENLGIWTATYVSGTQLTLAGVQRGLAAKDFEDAASVSGITGVGDGAIVKLNTPLFHIDDENKDLKIGGSTFGNDGTYPIVNVLSNYEAEVTNAGGFTAESGLVWEYVPNFDAEASVRWEMVETGSVAAKVLTLRDPLPSSATPVRVWYTTVLSAEVLLNEFVANKGEAVGEPDLYYPAYLYDIDSATRQMIEEITAAGVIPNFDREY